jgi:hypothetical protein
MERLAQYFIARPWRIFVLLWLLLFLIYLPAARSGMVGDSIGWLDSVRNDGFWDYLNRRRYRSAHSFYQFTLLINWLCYQLWGVNAWMWHLLSLTLHMLNAFLLYFFVNRLLHQSRVQHSALIALSAVVLYATSPYHVETVVWEASYHYLQGLLIILTILLLSQRYADTQKRSLAMWAGLLYALSIFSLEICYLTPLLIFTLALYYYFALGYDRRQTLRMVLYFSVPQVLLLLLQFGLFIAVYGSEVPHVGAHFQKMNLGYFATRPPEYLFHLFWGRFLPYAFRLKVHALVMTYPFAAFFYGALLAIGCYSLIRFRRLDAKVKVTLLFYVWMLLAVSLLLPLWFPNVLLGVSDRYLYVLAAFYFTGVTLLLSRLKSKPAKIILWGVSLVLNLAFTLMLTYYWNISTRMVESLETNVPVQQGKTVILLNSPASYKGIAMIGCTWEGEFKLVNSLLFGNTIPNRMTEVLGYNLDAPDDGAMVCVENDSTLQAIVRHPDINFWFGGTDGSNLETPYYKITGHNNRLWFRLVLKGDPAQYQLLYQSGMQLKTVDMSRRQTLQD